jgi:hypothetical protein
MGWFKKVKKSFKKAVQKTMYERTRSSSKTCKKYSKKTAINTSKHKNISNKSARRSAQVTRSASATRYSYNSKTAENNAQTAANDSATSLACNDALSLAGEKAYDAAQSKLLRAINKYDAIETAQNYLQLAVNNIINVHNMMNVTFNLSFASGKGNKNIVFQSNSTNYSYNSIKNAINNYYNYINLANAAIDGNSDVKNKHITINGSEYSRSNFSNLNKDALLFLNDTYNYINTNQTLFKKQNYFLNYFDINSNDYSFTGDSSRFNTASSNNIPYVSEGNYTSLISGLRSYIETYYSSHYGKTIKIDNVCDFTSYFNNLFTQYTSSSLNVNQFEKLTFFDGNSFSYYDQLKSSKTKNSVKYGTMIMYHNFIHSNKCYSHIADKYIDFVKDIDGILQSANLISSYGTFSAVKSKFVTSIRSKINSLVNDLNKKFNVDGSEHVKTLFVTNNMAVLDHESVFQIVENVNIFNKMTEYSKLCYLKTSMQEKNISTSLHNSLKNESRLSKYYHIDNLLAYINSEIMNKIKTLLENDNGLCTSSTADIVSMPKYEYMNSNTVEAFSTMQAIQSMNQGNLNVYEGNLKYGDFLERFNYATDGSTTSGKNNLSPYHTYLDDKFIMNNVSNYNCSTVSGSSKTLDAKMTYRCLDTTYDTESGILTSNVFPINNACLQDTCKSYKMKLKYRVENQGGYNFVTDIYLKVLNNGEKDGHDTNLNNDRIYVIKSNQKLELDALESVTSNDSIFELNTNGKNILYNEEKELTSDDGLFKLYIKSNALKLGYKVGFCKKIYDSVDENMMGDIRNKNAKQNTQDNYIALYTLDKYYHPEHISKAGYVDNNGLLNVYNDNNENKNILVNNFESEAYETYEGFLFINTNKLDYITPYTSKSTAIRNATNKNNVIGIYYDTMSFFLITYNDLDQVYHDSERKDHYLMIRMLGIGKNKYDDSCPSLPQHVNMISSRHWDEFETVNYDKNKVKCGFKKYFEQDLKKQEIAYKELEDAYEEFIEIYDKLIKIDKDIIKETNISMDVLEEAITEYNTIQKETKHNTSKLDSSNAQMMESLNDLNKNEFWFSVTGIVALASLTIMMSSLKK